MTEIKLYKRGGKPARTVIAAPRNLLEHRASMGMETPQASVEAATERTGYQYIEIKDGMPYRTAQWLSDEHFEAVFTPVDETGTADIDAALWRVEAREKAVDAVLAAIQPLVELAGAVVAVSEAIDRQPIQKA